MKQVIIIVNVRDCFNDAVFVVFAFVDRRKKLWNRGRVFLSFLLC